jgi:hypothetical protein
VADEPFGVCVVGGVQDPAALGTHRVGEPVVNVRGGVQPEPAVAMLVVVPAEEPLAVGSHCLDRAEPSREARMKRPRFDAASL